ncbi:MAG: hypothetical protein HN420_09435, partial [Rhodospirillaceae bacterium]|nr:hypothetical protein [Rhodospirillaceae bacterium]
MKPALTFLAFVVTAIAALPATADDACGQLITVDIRDGETQAYSFGHAEGEP